MVRDDPSKSKVGMERDNIAGAIDTPRDESCASGEGRNVSPEDPFGTVHLMADTCVTPPALDRQSWMASRDTEETSVESS
jgi:hypothetical protein